MSLTKNHRTALVIDGVEAASSGYRERVKRLLDSLNGSNIKVDVFTATKKGVVPGNALVDGYDHDTSTFESAVSEVAGHGYVQVLTSQPG